MHTTDRNITQTKRDFAYWREVAIGGLGMFIIVVGSGHFLNWLKLRKPVELELSLGFAIAYGIILILAPNRLNFVIVSLLAVVVCGAVNAFLLRSMLGLPIIIPCALLAYLLLRWKGNLLK